MVLERPGGSLIFKYILILLLPLIGCGRINPGSNSARKALLNSIAGVVDYQIGEQWSKYAVTPEAMVSEGDVFQRTAKATAKVNFAMGGATAFAIGQKDGQIVMATSYHVLENQDACNQVSLTFSILGISSIRCDKILGVSEVLDLTVFSTRGFTFADAHAVYAEAQSFSQRDPIKGRLLLTMGYGGMGNEGQSHLMATQDSDCKIFSGDHDVRFMSTPGQVNSFKRWMFSAGCDVSHGDSGSPVVDRISGDIIGILSSGKIPKASKVRQSKYLTKIFDESSEDVWQELTFVVPASKILEFTKDIF